MADRKADLDVADIVAIHQLLALYGHAADAAKHLPVEDAAQRRLDHVFTTDAVWDMTSSGGCRYEGIDAIRRMFSAPPPHHPPSHHTTNPYVYVEGGVTRARSKWLVTDTEDRLTQGEYHDVLVCGEVGWRIVERLVVTLSRTYAEP